MGKKKMGSTKALNEFYLDERCTLNKVLRIIGRRWVSEILLLIRQDICRFSQLKECLSGISDNVLSNALTELGKVGVIDKQIFQEVPLRVEYQITPSGLELVEAMHQLCGWGKKHISYEERIKLTMRGGDRR